MSGMGNRFVDAGYVTPKPLIEIDGKPIIEHVCDLFSGEDKFTFICNSRHLNETNMRSILESIRPNSNIIEIPNHKKGPVYAVSLILDFIDDNEEVIVNYCDFGTYWNYSNFLRHTRDRKADGAIPSYKGFHPHMLGSTNYAFIKEDKQWMLEIKEKEPFTDNRMSEFASNGTYYFRKGEFVKKYFTRLLERNLDLNGEFYVSLVYNLMVNDGLSISIYEIQHMLQWGTPSDVEEYKKWSDFFKSACQQVEKSLITKNSVTLIPLAGRGSRFQSEGYSDPKPLISVSGKPMIIQAAKSLPHTESYKFVVLKEHLNQYPLKRILQLEFPQSEIIELEEVTQGQSVTCSKGLKNVNVSHSLLISATDNGIIYNEEKFESLILDTDTDAIIFTFKNHQSSKNNPEMYGWVETVEDGSILAKRVSVKVPISNDPYEDHAIVGTFWFRNVDLFLEGFNKQIDDSITVNSEYYVDSVMGILINLGYRVKVFEVDHYVCWGTPADYETFVYWQSFFHKCNWHPYQLELDSSVNKDKIFALNSQYTNFHQQYE